MGGNTTAYAHDHVGRTTTVSDPVGDIDYLYNSLGLLSTVTDSLGHTTTNAYDGALRLTKVTDAIGKTTEYAYDGYGRQTKAGAGSGGSIDPTTYYFDNATGWLTKVEYTSNAYAANYYYDGEARLTKLTDWLDGTDGLHYAYDDAGRLTTLTDYDDSTLTYTYDDGGNVLTMNDYHGNSTAYTYNDLGQLSTLTAPGSKTWTYTYDGYSRLTKVDIPNGMHTLYAYDSQGRRTSIHHKDGSTVKQGFDYAFDDGGQITTITHEDGAYWAYEYDGRDRLTKAERYDDTPSLLHRFTYAYDDGDNMTTKSVYDPSGPSTETTAFTYNNANEQTNMNDGTSSIDMAYDVWGRLTSKGDGTYTATYAYRYGSKLYSVTSNFPGEGNVTYETGGDGKRRIRTAGTSTIGYNWDVGLNLLSEEDGAGTVLSTYVIESLGGRLSLRNLRSQTLAISLGSNPATGVWGYLALDHIWSIRGAFDQSRQQVVAFEYTPYGDMFAQSTNMDIVATFASHQWDDKSRMYVAPFRFYSADQARWIQRDPLGMVDGPNLYRMFTNVIDFLGLSYIDWAIRSYNGANLDVEGFRKCVGDDGCTKQCQGICECVSQNLGAGVTFELSACVFGCENGTDPTEVIRVPVTTIKEAIFGPGCAAPGAPGAGGLWDILVLCMTALGLLFCNGSHIRVRRRK